MTTDLKQINCSPSSSSNLNSEELAEAQISTKHCATARASQVDAGSCAREQVALEAIKVATSLRAIEEEKCHIATRQGQVCDTTTPIKFNTKASRKQERRKPISTSGQSSIISDKQQSNQLIDSRSILGNKRRLKRFWERKIEMEFKAKQQRQQQRLMANNEKLHLEVNGEECLKSNDENGNSQLQVDANNNNNNNQQNNCLIQTGQLISIDPTICHLQGAVPNATTTNFTSDNSKQEQEDEAEEEEEEEQSVNEEFSSTNSSFGPMSISVARNQLATEMEDDEKLASSNLIACVSGVNGELDKRETPLEDEEAEELNNSTCSGSVLTVISNSNSPPAMISVALNQCQDGDLLSEACSSEQPLNNGQDNNDDNLAPNAIKERPPLDDNKSHQSKCEELEEEASNIGVAFESLHFEEEIKSSRNELVDETELLMGSPRGGAFNCARPKSAKLQPQQQANDTANECVLQKKNQQGNKFSLERVKLACNFITNAIADATRQVDEQPDTSETASLMGANQTRASSANDKGCARPLPPPNDQTSRDKSMAASANCFVPTIEPKCSTKMLANGERPNEDEHELVGRLVESSQVEQIDVDERELQALEEDEELEELDGGERCCVTQAPRANLASIFEANVRREIERFESNSMLRKSIGQQQQVNLMDGKLLEDFERKSGLTEWKIAEEIRYFNEREEELKRRMAAATGGGQKILAPKRDEGPPGQQLEPVVRCGKLLHIPKYSGQNSSITNAYSNNIQHAGLVQVGRSLKLTSSATNSAELPPTRWQHQQQQQQQANMSTTISMHKFVSSGGKRFVQRPGVFEENLRTKGQQQQQLTKSMSNLSTLSSNSQTSSSCASSSATTRTAVVVDYRAIDSLNSREVPNVQAGLTRRTIETFSRLNNGSNHSNGDQLPSCQSMSRIDSTTFDSANSQRPAIQSKCEQSEIINNHQERLEAGANQRNLRPPASSAEQKIQEELRDIRAREAELESQRRNRQLEAGLMKSNALMKEATLSSSVDNQNDDELKMPFAQQLVVGQDESDGHLEHCADYVRSSSSDSLYPIKQTIESFRRLTAASESMAPLSPQAGGGQAIEFNNNNNNGKVHTINRVICKR